MRWLCARVGVVLALLLVAGCGSSLEDGRRLDALLEDPILEFDPPNAELFSDREHVGGKGYRFFHAEMEESGSNVHRRWTVEEEEVVASFHALVDAFEEADWTLVDLREDPPSSPHANFVKPMNGYCAVAFVVGDAVGPLTGVHYSLSAPYGGSDEDYCDRQ